MRNPTSSNLLGWLLASAAAAILLQAGVLGYRQLADKAHQQSSISSSVARWKHSYLALAGTQERWEKSFQSVEQLPDLLSVARLLRLADYGLHANSDALELKSAEPVQSNGIALGLNKLCLGTGGDSFVIEAANYETLFSGLEKLAQRHDLLVDNVRIVGEKSVAQARIGLMCLYFRSQS